MDLNHQHIKIKDEKEKKKKKKKLKGFSKFQQFKKKKGRSFTEKALWSLVEFFCCFNSRSSKYFPPKLHKVKQYEKTFFPQAVYLWKESSESQNL